MKISSLRISNILSFKYHDDIASAEPIIFEDNLNIIIGENGAGKSTALEVLNFLFKRVLYKQFNVNQELYSQKSTLNADQRKQILLPINAANYGGFRLEPNWDTEVQPQKIRLELKLDDIDIENIRNLQANMAKINSLSYTTRAGTTLTDVGNLYVLDITLNKSNSSFTVSFNQGVSDFGYEYLTDYNFYKESIALYNFEHPTLADQIPPLYESFTLISSYRNYHAFDTSVSIGNQSFSQQMQQIRSRDYSKSLTTNDQGEPTIFGVVRLRVAEKHYDLLAGKFDEAECEAEANKLPFIVSINNKLKPVHLKCKIRLIQRRTWDYAFEFIDTRRNKKLNDINSLSAGQKAIIHLLFEAYGRGELKGGVVIIDEPEIHLHYQFQNEYLQVVRELNKEQKCQYILVTHSEALINSSTINQVKRFSLDADGYTQIKAPVLTASQKSLIKILDNTRSTYAFFAKKVLLVEGDSDRYFFKSIIQEKYPHLDQEIAILYMGGKGGYVQWNALFTAFGLTVYCIGDFDFSIERFYPTEKGAAVITAAQVSAFKTRNPDWEARINGEYAQKIYILKNGDLEHYLGLTGKKDISKVIDFCNVQLASYLVDDANPESLEVRNMIAQIVA